MVRLIDTHLGRLRRMLFDMDDIVRKALDYAQMIVETGNGSVKEIDDIVARASILREETVDLGMETIARFQPVAKDLRLIRVAMDISYDLHRMARYCREVVRTRTRIKGESCALTRAKAAFRVVKQMIDISINLLRRYDRSLVDKILELDDRVDRMYIEALDELSVEDTYVPKCAAIETLILRHLERIADHAIYIATGVEFVETGKYRAK